MTFDFGKVHKFPINKGAQFISGYAFKSSDFCEVGIPVVKIKNIQNKTVNLTDSQCVPNNLISKNIEKFLLTNGDILIAMTGQGSVGRVGRLRCPINARSLMNQRVGKFIADEVNLNKDYLYYVISSSKYGKLFFDLGSGSGQPNLSPSTILSVEIPFPEYPQQLAISEIFNSLDDKITLLHETNSTLEAIAQTLFKSWFVDFDPVRAKSEGKLPEGMDEVTAALFPDSFDRGELSEIPKGWTNVTIENLCDVVTRGVSPVYKTGSNLFIVNQKVNRGRELDLSALKELSPRMHIPKEKMLNKWDLLINCLGEGTLGRVHLYKCVSSKYTFDQHMSICRGKPSVSVFLYQILSSTSGQEKIQALKTGSTGMTMFNISKLREYSIIWPGQLIVNQYFENTKNLFEKIAINDNQLRTLSSLRDTLIPRLILGKLRLPELNEINNKTKVTA